MGRICPIHPFRVGALAVVMAIIGLWARSAGADVIPMTVEGLTVAADRIVLADVASKSTSRSLPDEPITTEYHFDITADIKGTGEPSISATWLGGVDGYKTFVVSVLPQLQAGDHVLLFLDANNRLVGLHQGVFLTDQQLAVQAGGGRERFVHGSLMPFDDLMDAVISVLPAGEPPPGWPPYAGPFHLPLEYRFITLECDWSYRPDAMGEDFKINPNCSDAGCGDATQQTQTVLDAAATWDSVGAHFVFTHGGTTSLTGATFDGENTVYFEQSPILQEGWVALTTFWCTPGGNMVEWDIALNDRDQEFTDASLPGCQDAFDLKSVITHEFGHAVGLDHASDPSATMFGGSTVCDVGPRSLEPDDEAGITAIYGICGDGVTNSPEQCDGETYCDSDCRFAGNDDCSGAITLPAGVWLFDNFDATTDGPDEPDVCDQFSYSQVDADIWFSYTSPCDGQIEISLCDSDYDTKLAVYEGSDCPTAASALACNDDHGCDGSPSLQSTVTLRGTENETYLIRIGGYAGDAGDGILTIREPTCISNDQCPDALPISDGTMVFENIGADTDGPDEPDACNFFGDTQVGSDIWYCYSATCDGTVSIDLCGSDYDTKIAVYEGCTCPSQAAAASCNDDACGSSGLQSRLAFSASVGDTYLIRVGGFDALQGEGTLDVHCDSPSCKEDKECDDGVFCNGTEFCDEGECLGTGSPCFSDEFCDEPGQRCIKLGDSDADGDVDLRDVLQLQQCVNQSFRLGFCNRLDTEPPFGTLDATDWGAIWPHLTGPS